VKKIWKWIRHHLREDFNQSHYISIFFFLVICLFLNYKFDFQNQYLTLLPGFWKFTGFLLLYALAYFTPVFLYAFFYKKREFLNDKNFWFKSILVLVVLALDNSAPFLRLLIGYWTTPEVQGLAYRVTNNMMGLFTVLTPLLSYYYIKESDQKHVYGLQIKYVDLRPYLLMFALMIPLICIASFNENFLNQYPLYKTTEAHVYFGIPEWITVFVFELSYAFDFVSVEFLFRGFLVIGMMSLLGRNAVLTMAVVYCFLHFGKPLPEAISSVFGGYILGVISYEAKSIWGGVLIHIGIAWSMELASYVQKMQ